MRLEFVKAFVEITEAIFVEVLGEGVVAGEISLTKSAQVDAKVIVYIELKGDVGGRIHLQMDLPTATAIARKMSGREAVSRAFVASCIAELAGMTIGRAISWINDRAYAIDMSPPIVVMETKLERPVNVETLVFPIVTPYGEAVLNISIVDLSYNRIKTS